MDIGIGTQHPTPHPLCNITGLLGGNACLNCLGIRKLCWKNLALNFRVKGNGDTRQGQKAAQLTKTWDSFTYTSMDITHDVSAQLHRHLQSYGYINGIAPSSLETALQVSTLFLVLLCSPPRHLEPGIRIHNIVIININKMDDDISYSIKSSALWLLKSSFGGLLLGKQRISQIPYVNSLGSSCTSDCHQAVAFSSHSWTCPSRIVRNLDIYPMQVKQEEIVVLFLTSFSLKIRVMILG